MCSWWQHRSLYFVSDIKIENASAPAYPLVQLGV